MDQFVIFCIGLALLIGFLYAGVSKKRKFPPGPAGLPFLGYYPFFGKDPVKTMTELGKKYGNVFGLYVGPQYMVVLNDWEAMTDAYRQAPTLHRPPSLFEAVPYHFGIVGANGEEWAEVRRLMMKAIKDIGLHRTRWEELIQEEISEVIERITQHGTVPIDAKNFFAETFANNIMTLALGKRLHAGHPLPKMVARAIDTILEFTPTLGLMNFSPRLLKILQILGIERTFNIEREIHDFTKFVVNTVEEKLRNPDKETEISFIDVFCRSLQNQNKDKNYIESTVAGNVIALLTGGSETSRTTIIFALIAMADNPEKQQKVHEELDRVIGRDGCIQWADRAKVPYTFAALLESMRWKTIVPMSTLRMTVEDIKVQGYDIPKGTFLTFNTWALHNDPKYWDEPEKFMPERFLMENGKVNTDAKSYAVFSFGKRMCPGMLVGNMENLQYFISLMQKFKVVPADGEKARYDIVAGLTHPAKNIELCFIPRH